MTKLVRHFRRRKRIAGYVVSGSGWHERIHYREIDGIGVALIEAKAQHDCGSDQLALVVPLVFAGRGALGVVARDGDGQLEERVSCITLPLLASGFSGEKFSFPGLIPLAEPRGNVFSDANGGVVGS